MKHSPTGWGAVGHSTMGGLASRTSCQAKQAEQSGSAQLATGRTPCPLELGKRLQIRVNSIGPPGHRSATPAALDGSSRTVPISVGSCDTVPRRLTDVNPIARMTA